MGELEGSARTAMRILADGDQLAHGPLDWEPPDGLGELPEHLRGRALAVLGELDAVERGLENRRDQLGRQIADAVRSRPVPAGDAGRLIDRDM